MEYIGFVYSELPALKGRSEKQVRYAETLRNQYIEENIEFFESIGRAICYDKLHAYTIQDTDRIVLFSSDAYRVINKILETRK